MSRYDLSNEEIVQQWNECGKDPIRLWRVAVAHTSQAEMHEGIIPSTHSGQYDDIHLQEPK